MMLMSTHLNSGCSLARQELRVEAIWTPPHSQTHWELTRTKSIPVSRIRPCPTLQQYRVNRHCSATHFHKQLLNLKLEGGFLKSWKLTFAILMTFTSRNIHHPFTISFILQKHFLTIQVNQLSHPPSSPLLNTNRFVIYPGLGISKAPSYSSLGTLTSRISTWTTVSCMYFHSLVCP